MGRVLAATLFASVSVLAGLSCQNSVCQRGASRLEAELAHHYADGSLHERDVLPARLPEPSWMGGWSGHPLRGELLVFPREASTEERFDVVTPPSAGTASAPPLLAVDFDAELGRVRAAIKMLESSGWATVILLAKAPASLSDAPPLMLEGHELRRSLLDAQRRCHSLRYDEAALLSPQDRKSFFREVWPDAVSKCHCSVTPTELSQLVAKFDGRRLQGVELGLGPLGLAVDRAAANARWWAWFEGWYTNHLEGQQVR